jgi:general secretion pathway protein I
LYPAAPPSTERHDAGFTIIEVLVALALVAVVIGAVGSLMASNVRGVRSFESHVALMQATRAAMVTAVPPRDQLKEGTLSGQADGYRWTVDLSPLGGEWAARNPEAAWAPELVRIRVRAPGGATSDIRTVRLVRRAAE